MASNAWPTTPLGELCDAERGITYGIVKVGDFIPGGVPVVRGGDIRNGRILCDDSKRVTEGVSNQFRRTILKGGEIVLNLIADPGHSAIVPVELAGHNVSRDVAVIPLNGIADVRFVDFFLKSKVAVDWLTARLQGSVTQKINLGTLRELPVPLPPLAEQKAIAAVLGALDDKIELNRRMNATLEAMARALFQSWFVDFDPVRAKLDGRQPPNLAPATAALFPDSFQDSELGHIPQGWSVKPLSELVDVVKGRSYRSEELADSKTALVTLKSFLRGGGYRADGLKPFTGEYKPNQRVSAGDLVVAFTDVTQAADVIGKPALVRSDERFDTLVASLDVGIVRPKSDSVSIPFLYCLLLTDAFQAHTYSHATGTTVLHLSSAAIPSFQCVIPNPELAASFACSAEPLFKLIDENSKQSRTLATLRDTLLPKLLSGELSVANAL